MLRTGSLPETKLNYVRIQCYHRLSFLNVHMSAGVDTDAIGANCQKLTFDIETTFY